MLLTILLCTTITAHKGSQLLKLIETGYEVQPSDITSHRTYTTKNHNFTFKATSSIFTERDDKWGNQHYSRELLMMGIVVLETY